MEADELIDQLLHQASFKECQLREFWHRPNGSDWSRDELIRVRMTLLHRMMIEPVMQTNNTRIIATSIHESFLAPHIGFEGRLSAPHKIYIAYCHSIDEIVYFKVFTDRYIPQILYLDMPWCQPAYLAPPGLFGDGVDWNRPISVHGAPPVAPFEDAIWQVLNALRDDKPLPFSIKGVVNWFANSDCDNSVHIQYMRRNPTWLTRDFPSDITTVGDPEDWLATWKHFMTLHDISISAKAPVVAYLYRHWPNFIPNLIEDGDAGDEYVLISDIKTNPWLFYSLYPQLLTINQMLEAPTTLTISDNCAAPNEWRELLSRIEWTDATPLARSRELTLVCSEFHQFYKRPLRTWTGSYTDDVLRQTLGRRVALLNLISEGYLESADQYYFDKFVGYKDEHPEALPVISFCRIVSRLNVDIFGTIAYWWLRLQCELPTGTQKISRRAPQLADLHWALRLT